MEKLQLGRLAAPLLDRRRPVYNWFPMKEAFSRDLVGLLAETWMIREGELVLDPFCGTGTTPLACKEFGLDCVGYDVHPILLLASRVKLRDYDVEKLSAVVREIVGSKFEQVGAEFPGFVNRVFPAPVLADIACFRRNIMEVEDESTREFLLLGLAVAAMRCSWARKDGAAIRVLKRSLPPFRRELEKQLAGMCDDIRKSVWKSPKVSVEHCDARKFKLADESVDAVITSPPYLNKLEYVHVYRVEQALLGLEPPNPAELIGAREVATEDLSDVAEFAEGMPLDAKLYFKDMSSAIRDLYLVCKQGAKICMVTSDGCFPGGPVDVCVPLSELAEQAGFKAKRVLVVNKRHCTTPRRKKVGTAREGLLMWEK